jgi:hypothetical protein
LAARGVRAAAGDAGDRISLAAQRLLIVHAICPHSGKAFVKPARRTTSDSIQMNFKIKYSSFVKTPILDIIRRRGHHSSVLHPG